MTEKKLIPLAVPDVGEEEIDEIRKVVSTGFLTEGATTKEFETMVAEYLGVKHAIAVTSCTTGLHAVLECLDIKGQEIIVPDYTYPATAEAVVLAGGIPVLADVDIDSMNINSEILEEAYNEKMSVFSPVSWAGVPLEKEIYQKAKKLGLKMLEDSACSLGAKIGEDYVGKIADYSCFSFHPRKVITTGEGKGLTHLIIDDNQNRPQFVKDILINENNYPYLIKEFDSLEHGYKYNLKIYKIDYEKFDLMNEIKLNFINSNDIKNLFLK